MGCLVLLILAFIFRGAIVGLLALLLSAGIWGLIVLLVVCAIVAAFA